MTLKVGLVETEAAAKPVTGQFAHAEGSGCTASGFGAHAEGSGCTASDTGAHAEGNATTASGTYAHAEGANTTASGIYTHAEGNNSVASGSNSHAGGAYSKATRVGQWSRQSESFLSASYTHQICSFVLMGRTLDATPLVLTMNASAVSLTGGGTNVLTLPVKNAFLFRIEAVARRTDVQGEMAGWKINGLVGRDATGNARIIGSPTVTNWADAGAAAWTLTTGVDTVNATNNYLAITATGAAAKTINWAVGLYVTEVLTTS